ncbi:MAG: isopenicillin N synthase family oxygenase [Alphaproteobacteria bacterium]|nr:isopenicillin N synthase family oxygenase [Alphaproteobacteria bacterium]
MTVTETGDVRGKVHDDPEAIRLMDHPDSTEEIPTLDIGPYLHGEPGAREAVAARLREISMTVGFFYLKGHGLRAGLLERMFVEARRFHSLPEAEKQKIPYFDVASLKSGYSALADDDYRRANVNIIRGAKKNLVAKFSVNREGVPEHPGPVNVWPENLPGFKETLMEYHAAIETLGRSFLPLWAVSLGLPTDYFETFFAVPHLTLQLLHYPPQKEVGNRQYGIAPHTDNAMMTFLAQGDVPGLAVQMPSGHWRLVDTVPDALLVNTGNVIVRWTNNDYLSTKHRVINTHDRDRYSIPAFFGPSRDAVIEVVPTCQGPARPPCYEPITYRASRDWYYAPPEKAV